MKKAFRTNIESVLHRHIVLGVESVFSTVYSGPTIETLSFVHILNRVMMLVQLPITFIVMRKDSQGAYHEHFRTNKHPRHQDQINISKLNSQSEHYFPLWHNEISGGEFYLLVLKADKKYEFEQLRRLSSIQDDMTLWDVGSYKLNSLLSRKAYTHYPMLIESILKTIELTRDENKSNHESSQKILPQINSQIKERIKSEFDRKLLSNSGSDIYKELKNKGVLDRVYKKIARNISDVSSTSDGHGDRLTNFLLFARDYHNVPGNRWRHANYDYAIRMLICDTQMDELRQFLLRLKDRQVDFRNQYRKDVASIRDAEKNLALEIDGYFWATLMSGEAGEKRILSVISSYFSASARSMADPVFDGISFYRQPFANDAGIARCFLPNAELPGALNKISAQSEQMNDLLRVVACYYMFNDMAAEPDPSSSNHVQLQVMLNPVELGGRVWGVVGYATRSPDPDSPLENELELQQYDKYWSQNYHIYRDVNERMKKNLRSYMNTYYEKFAANLYDSWVRSLVGKQGKRLDELEDELNQELAYLTCLFPYDMLKVKLTKTKGTDRPLPSSPDEENRALVGRHWAAHVTAIEQVMFPASPGVRPEATVRFVDTTDVAIAMTDKLLRSAVEQHAAKE